MWCDREVEGQAGHSTRQQAELFISQQTSLLQFNETAALSPPLLQAKIKQLVKQNPDMAEAVSGVSIFISLVVI